MKKGTLVLVVLLFSSAGFSQGYSQNELSTKLKSSLRMKGTGQGLVAGGVVFNVVGLVLYVKGIDENNTYNSNYYYNESSSNDGSGKILGGLLLMIVGDVALATGITLWIVGGTKSNRYKRLLDAQERKLGLEINQKGIGISYHF